MDLSGLDDIITGLEDTVEEALDEAAEHALAVAKAHTKGELKASLRVKSTKGSREITTDKPYAEFVEQGRGEVVAQGKALHFVANGKDIFVKRVGPAQAHPFMAPAEADLAENAGRILEEKLGKL
jgi:hypothetical protein